jgi:hypothetical protein
VEALIVLVVFGSISAWALVPRWLRHRERMAELEVRRLEALGRRAEARALPGAREELAKELLAAYDEVDESLDRR